MNYFPTHFFFKKYFLEKLTVTFEALLFFKIFLEMESG